MRINGNCYYVLLREKTSDKNSSLFLSLADVFESRLEWDSNKSAQLQRLVRKKFDCRKFRYDTFQKANNKGADGTARMRRQVCAFVVRKHRRRSWCHITIRRDVNNEAMMIIFRSKVFWVRVKKKTQIGFQDRFSLNAGQTYCRMLQGSLGAFCNTFDLH